MKNLIITLGVIILIAVFSVGQSDMNEMQREASLTKNYADAISNAIALQLDKEEFGNGFIIFDYDKGNAAATKMIKENMNINDNFQPLAGSYFKNEIKMIVYYFDDSMACTKFKNNVNQGSTAFNYGDSASEVCDFETLTEEDFIINRPCVAVIIDAGEPDTNLAFFNGQGYIKKASICEFDYIS